MSADMRRLLESLKEPQQDNLLLELGRTTLPLRKGSMDFVRGSYGALVVVMTPMDFLRLTTRHQADIDEINQHADDWIDDYATTLQTFDKKSTLPYLTVSMPGGVVMRHEGRHRAALVMRSGGIKFPVAIDFATPRRQIVTWEEGNLEDDEDIEMERVFDNEQEAIAFHKSLKDNDFDLTGKFFSRIRLNSTGGFPHRGNPDRSDAENYRYSAWKKSDIPPVLIGQFNPEIRIPTNAMKVGIVKGYSHFRK